MASLVHAPCSTQLQARSMEVPEACSRSHHPIARRTAFSCSSWLFGTGRFLSPCICHQIPVENLFRFTLCIGNHNSLVRSPIMSMRKGNSTTTFKGLCKVVWTIEADLADGELLYITGDPKVLGSWEPEMAILMSPTEHANLWKAEVKIACGINFKYNFFIKGDTWPSCDIIWKPGPEFSLSVPLPGKQDREIVVRDSWMRFNTKRLPAHIEGSWMEETYLPVQSLISAPARDEDEIVKCHESDSLVKDISCSSTDEIVSAIIKSSDSNRTFSERNQPVEEPWLLQSFVFLPVSEDKVSFNVSKNKVTLQDEVTQMEFHNQLLQVTEKLLPEDESNLISDEDSVSTVILINSSICTMQRIAVLEDGNLVELLLEPVKSDVQVDSVYLGVVTKLVPHMGGAFVNIGSSRPSLMDIKHNREPFIFPPFRRRRKEKEVNGSVFGTLEEHQTTHENEYVSHDDVQVIDHLTEVNFQDDPVQFMHDDYEEHEVEDDFDVLEVLKGNVNGSIVNQGGLEADFEDYFGGIENHCEGENVSSFHPVEVDDSTDSQPSPLQDMKDSRQVCTNKNKWAQVQKGTKIIVQVVKEGMGTKGPTLTAYPKLRSRFWILITRCDRVGVSKKISGVERTRLKVIAKTLQPQGFGLTVRTVAAGHSLEELQKDLEGLLSTWKNIMEHAKSATLAADEGVEGAIPVILHRAMGQTLSIVQDYFNEKVKSMVVDSPRTYHEVTNYLQEIAPDLCDRVELFRKRIPLFDEFNIEEEINNILSKRVQLANGGSLVIEQTEALVSIDVNGGHGMLGQGTSQEKAILEVNLAAAKQIARELRLRDIGGIIVVDFIDMVDDSNKRLVYEEVKKAVERDRSMVKVSELSRHGLMEITRKRVRPSVTFMISEPCSCCHATGRVEALETSFAKIEQEICRLLAMMDQKADPENPKSWPRFILMVDRFMSNYLTSGKRTRLAILSSSLKVWILLKVARGFTRGAFEVKPFIDDKANKNQHQVVISMLRPTEAGTYNPSRKVTLFPVKKWKTRGK
ncbi:hypothetical protein L1049_024881 [Liquidambar formosana]|uniref:CBM20 domain-containing protein n=1 Tax=Liquidambar formosana TaxID=63359 RepID=A0AAP0X024_LIQFO